MQWVQAYELEDALFASVLRTFSGAFPYVYGFQASGSDVLLVGAERPLEPAWGELEARFELPAVRRHLASLSIDRLSSLLAFQIFSPATVRRIGVGARLENTDDNRLLESRAPLGLFQGTRPQAPMTMDERLYASPALLWSEYLARAPASEAAADTLRDMLFALSTQLSERATLRFAWQQALLDLDPGFAEQRLARRLLPTRLLALPRVDAARLVDRIGELHRNGDLAAVAILLDEVGTRLLVQAAMDPVSQKRLLEATSEWQKSGAGPGARLRQFRIQALMAARRLGDAAAVLEAWSGERPGPPSEWAALRACQLGQPALCDQLQGRLAPHLRVPVVSP